jgi:hypothetical protein
LKTGEKVVTSPLKGAANGMKINLLISEKPGRSMWDQKKRDQG